MAISSNNTIKTQIALLLSEREGSTLFTEEEIDYLLTTCSNINQAASTGWLMKADRLIALYPIASVALGSESYKFQSISEILSYCNERSRHYAKLAGAASGLILSLQPAASEAQ